MSIAYIHSVGFAVDEKEDGLTPFLRRRRRMVVGEDSNSDVTLLPERRLAAAILLEAVRTITTPRTNKRAVRDFSEAVEFLNSEPDCGFWLEALGLDYEPFRDQVLGKGRGKRNA